MHTKNLGWAGKKGNKKRLKKEQQHNINDVSVCAEIICFHLASVLVRVIYKHKSENQTPKKANKWGNAN